MRRNLGRINNFYNNLEARNDWARIAKTADPYIAALFAPRPDMSWRMIDKCIANLRDAMRPKWSETFTANKQAILGRICQPAPAQTCRECGHHESEHMKASSKFAIVACSRMGCDCVKPAPAQGQEE